ncbi:MAG: M1 family metallopeptidase [Saprospiraceae bacterium]
MALSAQGEALSPRTASYDMEVWLDTLNRKVKATQTLYFTNPSTDTIRDMRFHMYYNAWKNNQTDFFKEASRIPRTKSQDEIDNCIWSWTAVRTIHDEAGNDLSQRQRFVQPDNDNTFDHTVMHLDLVEPVLPGQTYRLEMEWEAQIPPLMIRTGYNRDYYFMVQWFPKLGVYEPAGSRFAQTGQWNCHSYHPATEYFGEFGVYDVKLHIPENYQVGASGQLQEATTQNGVTTWHYRANDVIDFAWTAHPGFTVVTEMWRNTEIRLLIRPEHLCNKERFLGAARHTLEYMSDYVGEYPYPVLTIVSPPFYGLNSGAMEYPTLITAPTLCILPQGIRTTETLVIHELVHQYFMQMVATNEQEEPWMDEGITAWFEARILDKYYPDGTVSFPGLDVHIGSQELRRGRFFSAENIQVNPLSDYGWHFRHGSYAPIVYGKPAVWLSTLEGLIGEDCMQQLMQTWFETWRFRHPCREDFIKVALQVTADCHPASVVHMVDAFLQEAIFGTAICDYSVAYIQNDPMTPFYGFFDNTTDCVNTDTTRRARYEATAVLFRHGDWAVPVRVQITFDDGSTVIEQWDGQARSQAFSYTGTRRIISAHIAPDGELPLDKNLLNNSYTTQPDKTGLYRYAVSFLTWLQNAMMAVSLLV